MKRNLKGKKLYREDMRVCTIKDYRDTFGEVRAKKKIECTKEELIPLIVIMDEADPGDEDLGNGNGDGDQMFDTEEKFSDG